MQTVKKTPAALLVDSLALESLRAYYRERLDLLAMCNSLVDDYGNALIARELFFSYRPNEPRLGLHNWAFMHGWQSIETRIPAGNRGSPSNATEIGASISKLLMAGIAQRIYVLANDPGISPFFRVAREAGVSVTLIYPDERGIYPPRILLGNTNEVLNPLKILGVLAEVT